MRPRPGNRATRGQVLVIFAVSAVALFGVLALAFDGGRILMEQRALQNAVDGAALTGALDIGPGVSSGKSHIGKDNVIYSLEKTLGVDFSNNYTATQQHYLNAGSVNCVPQACNPPYSDACCTWVDQSGDYTVTVTTPYNYNGADNEAFIHVDLVHQFPLLIGGSFFPKLGVHVQVTARNYALPFALYALKYYDPSDYHLNGNASLTANKKMGTNGGLSHVGSSTVTFECSALPSGGVGYGGDLHEYVQSASGTSAVNSAGIAEGGCTSSAPPPIGSGSPAASDKPQTLQAEPPVHLPLDPYGAVTNPPVPVSPASISSTVVLVPTIPADPAGTPGPRYNNVSVQNGGTLVLEPGVYFFEGTSSSGLFTKNSGATIITGDCYGYAVPSCYTGSPPTPYPPACPAGFGPAALGALMTRADTGAAVRFPCTSPDFGVLIVFYPSGSDQSTNPSNCSGYNPGTQPSQRYCTSSSAAGTNNLMSIWAGSTIYISSSPRYHNVAVFVDNSNAQGSTHNFTNSSDLSAAGCVTRACADQIGLGSSVVNVGGGGSISINGAILAPTDNVALGGGTSGNGYGQVIAYTLSTQGNGTVNESYNPLALAYSPVIVQ